MSDESTQLILGDAAAAGSEEIGSRRRKRRGPPPTHCQNCGAPLAGEYCAQCGQHAIDYKRSLFQLVIDAADSFFNWDTKFFRTIGTLLLKPWRLTNDFNVGRRVRHVHPLRLYLLASIAFFLMLRMLNLSTGPIQLSAADRAEIVRNLAKMTATDSPLPPDVREKVEAARAKIAQTEGALSVEERKAVKEAFRAYLASSVREKLAVEERERLRETIARLPVARRPAGSPSPAPEVEPGTHPPIPEPPPVPSTGPKIHFGPDENREKTPFEKWLEGRIREKIGEDGTKGELFLETLRENIPVMMLCCIPLFAFVLKVLYFWQRRFYIEHLVYALHIHSFAYIGVVVITLIGMALGRWSETAQALISIALSFALFVQVLLSIRHVYGQGWFFTFFKFILGSIVYAVILSIGIGATAFITLLMP